MNLLKEANLIIRQRGRGTFTTGASSVRGGEPNFHGLVENIRNFERNTQVKILKFHKVTTPERIREEFGEGGKQDCLKIVKVRSADRTPFSYSTCYVPYPEADIFTEKGLGNRSVLASLENAGIGVEHVDQRLTAVLADADIASHLKIDVGLPLISMRGVMRDAGERVVEVIEILYRPDCYVYRVTLSREGGKDSSPRWVQISEQTLTPNEGIGDLDVGGYGRYLGFGVGGVFETNTFEKFHQARDQAIMNGALQQQS